MAESQTQDNQTQDNQRQDVGTPEKRIGGWKAVLSLIVAVCLIALMVTVLFKDFGRTDAAMARAGYARTTYSGTLQTTAEEAQVSRSMVTYEEDPVAKTAAYDDAQSAEEDVTDAHTSYDPALYLDAAQMINDYDLDTQAASSQQQAAEAYQQAPAWTYTGVYEDETQYAAPAADDACIGDGLTY